MGVSRWIVCALFALAAAGCRSGGANNQELLERELRFQETELWRLRDEIDSLGCQMDAVQRENDSLKRELTEDVPAGAPSRPKPRIESSPDDIQISPLHRSRRAGPAPSSDAPVEIDMPQIDLGPGQSQGELMPPDGGPALDSFDRPTPSELPPGELPPPSSSQQDKVRGARRHDRASLAAHATPLPPDGHATRIAIVKQLTGGRDRDGKPGHEGITLAFEPHDENGQLVRSIGDVSIVVLDPASSGSEARVARWDFKSSEAASHFGGKGISRGYYFDLPWSGRPPANEKLQVFVRLLTPDGARLVADQNIDIALPPSKSSQTWNAARPRSSASALQPVEAGGAGLSASPGAQRPRFFSRVKPSSSPSANPGPANGAPLVAGGPDDAIEVYIDPQTGVATLAPSGGQDGSPARSSRFIDRTRLRGGPGLIALDGSMIRSWTGAAPPAKPKSAGPYRIFPSGAGDEGQVVLDDPAYAPNPGYNGAIVTRPPTWTDTAQAGGGSASPSGESLAPNEWVLPIEPRGGPPVQDESVVIEEPPAPRVSRPVWKPYR